MRESTLMARSSPRTWVRARKTTTVMPGAWPMPSTRHSSQCQRETAVGGAFREHRPTGMAIPPRRGFGCWTAFPYKEPSRSIWRYGTGSRLASATPWARSGMHARVQPAIACPPRRPKRRRTWCLGCRGRWPVHRFDWSPPSKLPSKLRPSEGCCNDVFHTWPIGSIWR